jgi:hypothetical protein
LRIVAYILHCTNIHEAHKHQAALRGVVLYRCYRNGKNLGSTDKIAFTPLSKVAFHRTKIPEARNCSPKLRYGIPHRISPIVVRNYENQRRKCIYAPRYVTGTIFIKLAEFHENSANNLFSGSMSEDKRTDVASTQGVLFFFLKYA